MATLNEISLLDYRTLLKVVELSIKSKSFLRDRFFPNVQTFETDSVDVDIIDRRGDQRLAAFSTEESNGTVSYDGGYVTENFMPAYIDERRPITGRDLNRRAPGETIYSSTDRNARMLEAIRRHLQSLEDRKTRREEWMAAQALITGRIPITGDGVNAVLDFWKYIDAADKPTLAVSTKWTASGAKPLDDLKTVYDRIGELSGNTPVGIVLGKDAWNALLAYCVGDGKSLFDSRFVDVGTVAPKEPAENGVCYKMTLREPSIDVYTYTGSYINSSGKTAPYVPTDAGFMYCQNAETTRAYGACHIYDQNGNEQIIAAPSVPNVWFQREKPQGRVVQLVSRPLLIVHDPQSFHSLTGLV